MNVSGLGGRPKLVTQEEFRTQLKRVLIKKFIEVQQRRYTNAMKDPNWVGISPLELREKVRDFAMGWSESAAARGDVVYCHAWAENFGIITTPDWWPETYWKFW